MKKLLLFSILLVMGIGTEAQSVTSQALAGQMASKMKDTLTLSSREASLIYQANMLIAREKEKCWKEYRASPKLRSCLQIAENRRDSLYEKILTKESYLKYLQNKKTLISSN